MLFLSASKGKLKLFKILVNNFQYSHLNWDIFLNTCMQKERDNVLSYIANIYPEKTFEKMIQGQVSGGRLAKVYAELDYEKKIQLDHTTLVKIASVISVPVLFEMGSFAPRIALLEIINQKKVQEISRFLEEYLQNLDTNDKKIIYNSLIELDIDDLVDEGLISLLKRDFSITELQEFKDYKSLVFDAQCHICMDNVMEILFDCENAENLGHGACEACYTQVLTSSNPRCPWCDEK